MDAGGSVDYSWLVEYERRALKRGPKRSGAAILPGRGRYG
jgi:hypothetical protein